MDSSLSSIKWNILLLFSYVNFSKREELYISVQRMCELWKVFVCKHLNYFSEQTNL